MGKLFLHGRTRVKEDTDIFAKLTVRCPLGVTVRASSVNASTVMDVVSNNGLAVFNRLEEGEWDITFIDVEYPPIRRINIDSLNNEITMVYFEATVNVTYPPGSICTCSNGDTVLTAPDTSGSCVFTVLNAGEWTITSVKDDLVTTETLNLTIDGQTIDAALRYFEATINIAYPVGSTCTVSNGVKTYTSPDRNGTWSCVVNYLGEWTISCTNGDRTESTTVVIESDGQSVSIRLKYFEATINITYPEGATCTVSNVDKTYTAPDASGTWVCVVPNLGDWRIDVSDDVKSKTNTVTITEDGQTVDIDITLFEAHIAVTYPEGSTCTVSNGNKTYTAPDTSGTWDCIVPNVGTWTVSCTDGSETASEPVEITSDGEQVSVELAYWHGELYDAGREFESVTGGWQARGLKVTNSQDTAVAPEVVRDSNSITASQLTFGGGGVLEITRDFDLTGYNTLTFDVSTNSGYGIRGLAVYDRGIVSTGISLEQPFSNTLAYRTLNLNGDFTGEINIDVSTINESVCIGLVLYNFYAADTPSITMKKAYVS